MEANRKHIAIRPEATDRALPPSIWAALSAMVPGRQRAVFQALLERETLSWADMEAIFEANGWRWGLGRGEAVIQEIRRRIKGTGWHVARTPQGMSLREGPPPDRPTIINRSPAPQTHGIERPSPFQRRPVNPSGLCQYMVVEGGRAVPCGAPAKGVYCDRHRAKSAGVPFEGEN